ncbi:tunicamycin resistance protein [Coemansia sp. RSA 1807]|nr:tunicamycin resistance protein [Coemansia sp. RSA 921]KAJ2266395.1 tunicamycin resistance protein [Coemansia sp. RSA 451]KAJ2528280.1 tunicamycin resistance protein [Coemansia sp. RSA 1937]KAJ2574795.1 tunicamycin resistance protein [Coemansia sp. RSA 1807]
MYKRVSLVASPVLLALLWQLRNEPLAVCSCISILAGLATWCIIPATTHTFKRVGLAGRDMSKPLRPELAESMGMVAAAIYLVATFLFIPVQFHSYWSTAQSPRVFPYARLGEYLSALLSLQSMVFLGFADDVFNLRWRFKLVLPIIASVPVLIVYYVGYGVTQVVVPVFLRPWLGTCVDLGVLYYVYIGLMSVFCTNAINILAGINGVEVGQSLIIAVSIVLKDLAYVNSSNPETEYRHLFSLYLLLPFIAVSCALYYWNKYPAQVFVGDTYCYFAGMTFAVCGILGHFSKTLLLLFAPQMFNFVYSAPQIFGLVPCPRHRLPQMVQNAGPHRARRMNLHRQVSTAMRSFSKGPRRTNNAVCMVASRTLLDGTTQLGLRIIRMYECLGLVDIDRNEDGTMHSVNNLTLLNLVLIRCPHLTESQLNHRILLIQLLNSCLAFIIRFQLSHLFYF